MTWAQRRKLTYLSGVFLVFASIAFGIYHRVTDVAPTCSDGKQNQGEKGVDCGGVCAFYCVNELGAPKVRWVRTFKVTPGIVHAIAYIEHSYPTAAIQSMRYSFKLYDEKNTLITERIGATFLGPMGRTAIVETLIKTGNVVPTRTTFTILPPLDWQKIPVDYSQVVIKTDRTLLEPFDGGTRLTATLENESRYNFQDLDVVAILYDESDNAMATSKSLLLSLPGKEAQTMYFTWPYNMPSPVARIEILPRFNPFTATAL